MGEAVILYNAIKTVMPLNIQHFLCTRCVHRGCVIRKRVGERESFVSGQPALLK